jgi:hypothetical protein
MVPIIVSQRTQLCEGIARDPRRLMGERKRLRWPRSRNLLGSDIGPEYLVSVAKRQEHPRRPSPDLLMFNQRVVAFPGSTSLVRIRARYGHGKKMLDPSDRSSPQVLDFIGFSGATRRIRTDDLLITNQRSRVKQWTRRGHEIAPRVQKSLMLSSQSLTAR